MWLLLRRRKSHSKCRRLKQQNKLVTWCMCVLSDLTRSYQCRPPDVALSWRSGWIRLSGPRSRQFVSSSPVSFYCWTPANSNGSHLWFSTSPDIFPDTLNAGPVFLLFWENLPLMLALEPSCILSRFAYTCMYTFNSRNNCHFWLL